MKFAISNIAWDKETECDILLKLSSYGVMGIELVPTITFGGWDISEIKAKEYKKKLDDLGFKVPAFQSILFGKPELQLFDKYCWNALKKHINKVSGLASIFGAKVLVFGAPKNRLRNQISYIDAEKIAVECLSELSDICVQYGCCIGLEANPKEYNCDFVTNIADAIRIVECVNKQGLKLHFDSAGAYMCGGGAIEDAIKAANGFIHYHISEPMLGPIIEDKVKHAAAFKVLREIGYDNWVSIEMKKIPEQKLLFDSVEFIRKLL